MIPPQRLVISSISTGYETYEKPFLINNDAFPILQNALCWRKRIIKKPGASQLGRLTRTLTTKTLTQTTTAGVDTTILDLLLDTGVANPTIRSLQPNAAIMPGSVSISVNGGTSTWNDSAKDGNLTAVFGNASGGTINYSTAEIALDFTNAEPGGEAIVVTFSYYPLLPVMGIESFESDKTATDQIDLPINVFFDQTYSYQYNGANFYDTSFYKSSKSPVTWSGANYQQFDSCNYYRAMFVTNNKPGFSYGYVHAAPNNPGSTTLTLTFYDKTKAAAMTTLILNDYVYFNEGTGVTWTANGQSGYVSQVYNQMATPGKYDITFPSIQYVSTYNADSSIVQFLTNRDSSVGDGIRWYDGDPSGASTLGWVNFSPPLDNLASSSTTYLMGARIIFPFGNRLLAIGTYEATAANASSPTYYGNRIRYCEVSATPFYAQPIPATVPTGTYEPLAWASNLQGFGGFIDLDTTQRIISAAITQGSLILGLESEQRRMSNTGIETDPYSLQIINPEYGSSGTFSIIPMDKGILTMGEYGFLMTSSYNSQRFDEKIIDQIFSVNAKNNGFDRICGGRDFYHEVVHFTYLSDDNDASNIYPNRTIVYNYRENSFALWKETYSTYGLYKLSTTQTWPNYFMPWESWFDNWEDLGGYQYVEPFVAGGTPQGFVMLKWDDQSFNSPSLCITDISLNIDGTYNITSPNHNLEGGDFIGFWPTVPSNTVHYPSFIGSVDAVTDIDNITVTFPGGTNPGTIVAGIWQMSVIDNINIYTKQFPVAWSNAKKTRIGAQKYFLDRTTDGEFTVNILGSQSSLPLNTMANTSVIFSNTVRTKPDDSLGINAGQENQTQIWHRLSSSAIGDTVQLQFTLSDDQMYDVNISTSPWILHSIILDLYPSRTLA